MRRIVEPRPRVVGRRGDGDARCVVVGVDDSHEHACERRQRRTAAVRRRHRHAVDAARRLAVQRSTHEHLARRRVHAEQVPVLGRTERVQAVHQPGVVTGVGVSRLDTNQRRRRQLVLDNLHLVTVSQSLSGL